MFEGNKLICPISKSSKFLKLFTFRKFPIYMGVVEKNYKAEFKNSPYSSKITSDYLKGVIK